MIRVLVAENSPTIRELLVAILDSDPQIAVIGQARNGHEVVELAERLRPDLILMGIHLPVRDGLEATKEIMIRSPTPIVIVSSRASERDVELSLSATRAGALMALPTPPTPSSAEFDEHARQLVSMAKAMAAVKVVRHWTTAAARQTPRPAQLGGRPRPIRLVTIAASTGGPAALQRLLIDLPHDFPVPILVVQHIAPGFVDGLRAWLAANSRLRVRLASDGEPLDAHTVYLAPDGYHLGVGGDCTVRLSTAPPIGGFRPSANFLFESAARTYGASLVAVILTGMGRDGVDGLRAVQGAGGLVLAQDEATSVIYGMPREALRAGVVNRYQEVYSKVVDRELEGMKKAAYPSA